MLAKHFEYVEEPMYYYYQHDASTVHTVSPKRCEDRFLIIRHNPPHFHGMLIRQAIVTARQIPPKRCEDRMEAGRLMLEEAKRHHYYEEFMPELEYSFTLLFYINTLFTYPHKKYFPGTITHSQ